jgi:hypothetical protein
MLIRSHIHHRHQRSPRARLQIIVHREHRELALAPSPDSWRRRSQRAVPANNRSGRKIARPKRRFQELIIPDEIHDLLRWSNWIRAYRAATEFFDRKSAAGRTAMSQVR